MTCHPRAGGDLESLWSYKISAFAEMTKVKTENEKFPKKNNHSDNSNRG